jgi:hypothetical protein
MHICKKINNKLQYIQQNFKKHIKYMHIICKNLHKQFRPATPWNSRRHTSVTSVSSLPDAPLHALLSPPHACYRSNSHTRRHCTTMLGRYTATLASGILSHARPPLLVLGINLAIEKKNRKGKRFFLYTCMYKRRIRRDAREDSSWAARRRSPRDTRRRSAGTHVTIT